MKLAFPGSEKASPSPTNLCGDMQSPTFLLFRLFFASLLKEKLPITYVELLQAVHGAEFMSITAYTLGTGVPAGWSSRHNLYSIPNRETCQPLSGPLVRVRRGISNCRVAQSTVRHAWKAAWKEARIHIFSSFPFGACWWFGFGLKFRLNWSDRLPTSAAPKNKSW